MVDGCISSIFRGSGLGLSIARSLIDLMHGNFSIAIDGDLFKVQVILTRYEGAWPVELAEK